ncbi:MAG: DUF4830 domain-containing protein [Clostridiales bacterium]|nr:DUF4830 domain-containing protein [Clostridiales bacterium]
MVVFSTKFNKKRAIVAVVVLAVVLVLIVLLAGRRDNSAQATLGAVVKDNAERVTFLKDLGWKIEEQAIEEQDVVIPKEFNEVYARYNEIQMAQGFDLSKYAGVEAKRYTYRILNYPGEDAAAVADIIIYRNEIIAGDVQSNRLDGFMAGLAFPKNG